MKVYCNVNSGYYNASELHLDFMFFLSKQYLSILKLLSP